MNMSTSVAPSVRRSFPPSVPPPTPRISSTVERLQAFATVQIRYENFWNFTQRSVVVSYRCFGTSYRAHLQGQAVQEVCQKHLGTQFIQGVPRVKVTTSGERSLCQTIPI
jgi:hypothetical protein